MDEEVKISIIQQMTPHVNKLVVELAKQDITFSPTDGELENVIFSQDGVEMKIAHHCFYRFSGMCVVQKTIKKETKYVSLSDDEFINIYLRTLIEHFYKK